MTNLWLALASMFGWFVSNIAGGGSSFILMPIVGLFLGTIAIPPVITTGGILGNAERVFNYWQKINWTVIFWELPGTIVGGCLGAFIFTQIPVKWLSFLVGLFLLISGINLIIKNQENLLLFVYGIFCLQVLFIRFCQELLVVWDLYLHHFT